MKEDIVSATCLIIWAIFFVGSWLVANPPSWVFLGLAFTFAVAGIWRKYI